MDEVQSLARRHAYVRRVLQGEASASASAESPVLGGRVYVFHTGEESKQAALEAEQLCKAHGRPVERIDRTRLKTLPTVVALTVIRPFEVVAVDKGRRVVGRITDLKNLPVLLTATW